MYGTVATIKVKPGSAFKLVEMYNQWWSERGSKLKGAVSGTLYQTDADPSQYLMTVVFASKEDYRANAEDPEQDKWFREISQLFDGEPTWMDGEVLSHVHT